MFSFKKNIVSKSVLDAFMKARQEEYLKTVYSLVTIPALRAATMSGIAENDEARKELRLNPLEDRKENVKRLEFHKNREDVLTENLKNLDTNEKNLVESLGTLEKAYFQLSKMTGYKKCFNFFR